MLTLGEGVTHHRPRPTGHYRPFGRPSPQRPAVSMTRGPGPNERARRREELADGIAARLRGVCGHMPDDEFARLVQSIAEVTLKYEERELAPPFERPDPPRLGD